MLADGAEVWFVLYGEGRPLAVADERVFRIELLHWTFQSSVGSDMISLAVTQRA